MCFCSGKQDIGSVIMVVGGPDGIKRPIMKDLSDILRDPQRSAGSSEKPHVLPLC